MKRLIKIMYKIFILLFLLHRFNIFAELPVSINYQGRYFENGEPVTGTRSNCYFKITNEAGTVTYYSTGPLTLNFYNGLFNYQIPCSTVAWGSPPSGGYYLQVEIAGNVIGREKILSVPYSFYAISATSATYAGPFKEKLVIDLTDKTGSLGRDAIEIHSSADNYYSTLLTSTHSFQLWSFGTNNFADLALKDVVTAGEIRKINNTTALVLLGGDSYKTGAYFKAIGSAASSNAGGAEIVIHTSTAELKIIAYDNETWNLLAKITGAGGIPQFIVGESTYSSFIDLKEIATPANPLTNRGRLFAKDVAGATALVWRTSDGNEIIFSTAQAFLSGSGTTNRVAKFTSANILGDSQITDTGVNVGVGITSPTRKLDVSGGAIIRSSLTVTGDGLSGTMPVFEVAGSTMVVRYDGNVGIGTSAPSYKLDVAGTGRFTGTLTMSNANIQNINHLIIADPGPNEGLGWNGTAAGWVIDVSPEDRSNTDGNLNLYGTANNVVIWRPTKLKGTDSNLMVEGTGNSYIMGNVGIGTTSPGSKLEVYQGNIGITRPSGDTTSAVLYLNQNNAASGGNYAIAARNTGELAIYDVDAAADRVCISPEGNIGIGTTAPTAGLDIRAKVYISSNLAGTEEYNLYLQNNNATNLGMSNTGPGGRVWMLSSRNTSASDWGVGGTGLWTISSLTEPIIRVVEVSTAGLAVQGKIRATKFIGDGSELTGIGNISGSGTTNRVAKFTAASTIGDSNITDTGSLITLQGTSAGTAVNNGAIYINNTNNTSNQTILGLATAGTQKFRFDNDGDLEVAQDIIGLRDLRFVNSRTSALGVGPTATIYYDKSSSLYRIDITTRVRVGGELQLRSNVIQDSGSSTRIRLATAASGETIIYSTVTAAGALKSNVNRIIDSSGNTRITFAATGDNVTLTGTSKVSGQLIVTGSATVQGNGLWVNNGITLAGAQDIKNYVTTSRTMIAGGTAWNTGGIFQIFGSEATGDAGPGGAQLQLWNHADSKFEIYAYNVWTRRFRVWGMGGVRVGSTNIDPGANNLAVDGQIQPGGSTERYIYDDPTNFATRFSSHVYANGGYGGPYAPVSVYPLGITRLNPDAVSGVCAPPDADQPPWKNNTTAEDWQWRIYRTFVNSGDYTPHGKIEVKVMVLARCDYEQSLRFTVRDANTNTFGNWNPSLGSAGPSGTNGSWFEGPWSTFQFTDAPHEFRLSCFTTDGSSYCIYKALILIRPKL